MDKGYFVQAVKTYIHNQDPAAPVSEIDPQVNLFDAGLLESFKLPQLVSFLTNELKLPVDLTSVSMEAFYTIDQMYTSFAQPASR